MPVSRDPREASAKGFCREIMVAFVD